MGKNSMLRTVFGILLVAAMLAGVLPTLALPGTAVAATTTSVNIIKYAIVRKVDRRRGHLPGRLHPGHPAGRKRHAGGQLQLTLMCEQDRKSLSDDDGRPLRLAVIGDDGLLTEGFRWVRWVDRIEVISDGWSAQPEGKCAAVERCSACS